MFSCYIIKEYRLKGKKEKMWKGEIDLNIENEKNFEFEQVG